MHQYNGADIARMCSLLLVPGAVAEVRVLGAPTKPPSTWAGWFDSAEKMVGAIESAAPSTNGGAHGIYVTLNPVRPELLARRANKLLRADRDLSLTGDTDILGRRWLYIDCDPARPSGISATETEHAAALDRATQVRGALSARGWPAPVEADSGNGAALLYRVDLANDAAALALVKRTLMALALRFGGRGVEIDPTVCNAARIIRIAGTLNAKGDDTPDRPHRVARLLHVPDPLDIVSHGELAALAAEVPAAEPVATRRGGKIDLELFLLALKIPHDDGRPFADQGTLFRLHRCPFSEDHVDGAYAIRWKSGAVVVKCHHHRCVGRGWADLRDAHPAAAAEAGATGYPERKGQREAPQVLGPITLRLSDVTAKPIAWLWRGRLAIGELTLMIGDPGEGKGLISAGLAARITRGDPLPGGPEQPVGPATVVVLSGEDNPETVIRPRYEAAGAVLERVVLVPGKIVRHEPEGKSAPTEEREEPIFLTDLEPLRQVLDEHRPRLLVIDPLQQYLAPETDSRRANQTRPILEALMKLAREFDVAVLALYHMNKDSGQTKAMYRALDSIDIPAAARLMLLVGHDPDHETKRAVVPVKCNLARKPEGLGFTILAESEDAVPTIAWTGPTDLTQETILGGGRSSGGGKSAKVEEAVAWLLDLLRPLGEAGMPPDEVAAAATQAGISERTLERAKKQASVISRRRKQDEGGGWVWSLFTHCWSCRGQVGVETHERCAKCHWLRCTCGACKEGCEAASTAAEPEGEHSLWDATTGWGRRQHRQRTDHASNTPGDLASLIVDHEAQGLATPPNQTVNGGVAAEGGEAPLQVPLPDIEEHTQANPLAAEDGSSAHPLRRAESTPPFTDEVGGVETPWAPRMTTKAAKFRRQLGTSADAGDVGMAASGAPPDEAAPPTPDGDDLTEVTI